MTRLRANFIGGQITDNPLTSGATTFNSGGLAALGTIASPDYLAIILDPDGNEGAPEIAWITAHTAGATSATISRGQEGSSAGQHSQDVYWSHDATAAEIGFALFKAGAVTDADFSWTPFDGMRALDTTNSRLYVRIGGTWKYTALT